MEESKSRAISLQGVLNIRDLGGLPTTGDRRVAGGIVFRSDTLAVATDSDREVLNALRLKTIVDVRGHAAFERHHVGLPEDSGVRVIRLPMTNGNIEELIPALQAAVNSGAENAVGAAGMVMIYRSFPRDFMAEAADFLRLVSDESNHPLLVHCSAGKDRTGFLVSLLLALVGVPREEIERDYLLSNGAAKGLQSRIPSGGLPESVMRSVVEARREYLDASFAVIAEEYGGLGTYARDQLRLTDKELEQLKDAILT